MLEWLLEQRDAVTLVLGTVPAVKNLSPQQWSTAADLALTLRPFMDVTREMCGATYPTLSMIIPVVDGLQNLLETTRGGLDILRDVLLRLMAEKFGNVFSDATLCAATTVDPRFKLYPFDTDERRERARQATLTPTTSATTATSNSDAAGSASLWDKLNRATAAGNSTTATTTTRRQTCERELEQYAEMPVLGRSECPYKWWATNQHLFPMMAGVARQLLCCPATSVSSEQRLFLKAGDIITKKRNSLAPAKAHRVVFLMENL